MLQTLKKFFAFCGEDNRKLFVTSIWLGVPRHHRCITDCDHRHQHEGYHAPDPCRLPCLRQQAD